MNIPDQPPNLVYAHFDGDDVGPQLELHLLDNKIEDARAYSRAISDAIAHVLQLIRATEDADIIAAGGDDVFVSWPAGAVSRQRITEITEVFRKLSGRTMSVGVGTSPREAAESLHRAKLTGKNQMICPPGVVP